MAIFFDFRLLGDYWQGSVVTMGNDTYSFINNEWQKMVPKYLGALKKKWKIFNTTKKIFWTTTSHEILKKIVI